jgi:hypothetical protein
MSRVLTLAIFLLALSPLLSFQYSSPSLATPTALSRGEAEIGVLHRFYGPVDEDVWNSLFGLNAGANTGFTLRRNILYNAELKAGYVSAVKRVEAGASWRPTPNGFPAAVQLDVAYADFRNPVTYKRVRNLLYLLSAQNNIHSERAIITLNAGYDGYFDRFVNGWGASLRILENLWLVGEYYPVWDRNSAAPKLRRYLGDRDVYVVGIKLDTYGHHFMFSLSNGEALDPASQSLGTDNSDLRLGFVIQRRF